MKNNTYFENYKSMNKEEKINHCLWVISDCEYWIEKTSNKRKISYRKQWIKTAQEKLKKLNQKQSK